VFRGATVSGRAKRGRSTRRNAFRIAVIRAMVDTGSEDFAEYFYAYAHDSGTTGCIISGDALLRRMATDRISKYARYSAQYCSHCVSGMLHGCHTDKSPHRSRDSSRRIQRSGERRGPRVDLLGSLYGAVECNRSEFDPPDCLFHCRCSACFCGYTSLIRPKTWN
jgi:hypothetical protein